jgi:MFS family permease
LILGALFTACAVMTKGVFVLVTIVSGLIVLWIYTKQYLNILRIKWLVAILLSFIFIAPEIIALYIQFDMHPQQQIFNMPQHISGIRWFFWDSQFGRFFNNGPIVHNGSSDFSHYFFFIHTFLWSFLPWSFILLITIFDYSRKSSQIRQTNLPAFYYLIGSFLPTFILFSISKFQLDYYINILIPFAAILCASWFVNYRTYMPNQTHKIFYIQIWFAVILVLIVIGLSIFVFGQGSIIAIGLTGLLMLIFFIGFTHQNDLSKAILYPVLAICLLFIFMILIYGHIYAKYDTGYQAANYLNRLKKPELVIGYNVNSLSLRFHSKYNYIEVGGNDLTQLKAESLPFYMLLKADELDQVKSAIKPSKVSVLIPINGATIDVVIANLLSIPRLEQQMLQHYLLVKVE